MNLAKQSAHSAVKSSFKADSFLRTTMNFSILDTLLLRCRNFKQFNEILCQMVSTGFIKDTYAASRILKFSTGSNFIHISYSHSIFCHIENPNGFIWNTMLRAFVQENQAQNSIFLYKSMLKNSFLCIDNYTYPILIQGCTAKFAEFEGRELHDHVVKTGFDCDVYVANNLIYMYSEFGKVSDSRRIFDESPVLDSVSWNSMLAGYASVGNVEEAMLMYNQMPKKNVISSNSMIVLLGKKGMVGDACHLFNEMKEKDLVSWTALISCYEQNGMYTEALDLLVDMHHNGVKVDEVVGVSVISTCANLSNVRMGESIHTLFTKVGLASYLNLQNALIFMYLQCGDVLAAEKLFDMGFSVDLISWNSMISGYLRCGLIKKARELFDTMPKRDLVSWSAMISGYTQLDRNRGSLALFKDMQYEGFKPDETILVSVISACAHLAALDLGHCVVAYIWKSGLNLNTILGTTIVDMYMKCGCVDIAMNVFHGMEEKGISTWNAVILGFAMNGQVERSLDIFEEMKKCVVPSEVTFLAVLGACRHVGLVELGRQYFDSMASVYNIEPNIKHYGCMVDLLGRAGLLKEAEEVINSMPIAPDDATWGALLGACKKHGDNEMGERIGRKLIELQPEHDGFHVLLSNIYASKGNWALVLGTREMMIQNNVVKIPGCSMIEANGVGHEFLAGDRSHPRINEIEDMLEEMVTKLKILGYTPRTDEVLLDIDEEEKQTNLFRHSEKLAIAFGLIATSAPTPIRIMKNLRICNDCHVVARLVSKAFDREIVVRDRHRFHHFKYGLCSCKEYW